MADADPTVIAEALATMDATLHQLSTEPSWAHKILTATAVTLATEEPFLTATTADVDAVLTSVAELLLSGLPDAVADEAIERAASVVPMPQRRESQSRYALRLRAAAEEV